MNFIYNCLLAVLFPILKRILRKKFGEEEFGIRNGNSLPAAGNHKIWLHLASVGEFNGVKTLAALLKEDVEDIIISTTSVTGLTLVKENGFNAFLLPFDFKPLMKKLWERINPQLLLITETELWPNLLHEAKEIPIVVINGRIGEDKLFFYKLLKPLIPFRKLHAVLAQSEADAMRYSRLGVKKVSNCGNLKFCLQQPAYEKQEVLRAWGLQENDFIITFGSSRPGEEEMLKKILPLLKTYIPNLKFIVAPRHLERLPEVKRIFTDYDLIDAPQKNKSILLIDKMGILTKAYSISKIAITGGSFYDFGGHNPLEAAYYGVPGIIGPYHRSCRDSVRVLHAENGIFITDEKNLAETVIKLFNNEELRHAMGKSAKAALQKNSQSLNEHYRSIKEIYESLQ